MVEGVAWVQQEQCAVIHHHAGVDGERVERLQVLKCDINVGYMYIHACTCTCDETTTCTFI